MLVWVGVIAVVLGILIVITWKPQRQQQPAPTGPAPVFAPQGQLTPNFPTALILDPQAEINSSYSINYDASTNQYTAEWNSSSSMASLYNNYKTYFGANGWTITNNITKYSSSRGLYASNASSDVAVGIVSLGNDSQVTISYITN